MITLDQARLIAQAYVDALRTDDPTDRLVLLDSETIEKVWGWVFFYQSSRWLVTKAVSDALAGNSPIIVSRAAGTLHVTGTAYPLDHYIARFERSTDPL